MRKVGLKEEIGLPKPHSRSASELGLEPGSQPDTSPAPHNCSQSPPPAALPGELGTFLPVSANTPTPVPWSLEVKGSLFPLSHHRAKCPQQHLCATQDQPGVQAGSVTLDLSASSHSPQAWHPGPSTRSGGHEAADCRQTQRAGKDPASASFCCTVNHSN